MEQSYNKHVINNFVHFNPSDDEESAAAVHSRSSQLQPNHSMMPLMLLAITSLLANHWRCSFYASMLAASNRHSLISQL